MWVEKHFLSCVQYYFLSESEILSIQGEKLLLMIYVNDYANEASVIGLTSIPCAVLIQAGMQLIIPLYFSQETLTEKSKSS